MSSQRAIASGDPAKPWTRWWWMGSAVDEKELTRHLEAYAKAGLGGVEICPIYGARGYEDAYVQFLSPRWRQLLRHTLKEACRLGVGVDLTLGTGWPYGGPMVSKRNAPKRLKVEKGADGRLSASVEGTGQQVKRAAPGGEGDVMCPYTREAIDEYLKAFETLFAEFEELPRCLFYDSFEVFKSDWANGLPEKFKEAKGYDLMAHLEELAAESDCGEKASRVRCDYRDTLFAMLLEGSVKPWTAWANAHGVKTRYQAHGAPGNLLDLYAASDVPETEVFGSNSFAFLPAPKSDIVPVAKSYQIINKFASSAARLSGKRLASSETFTWLREHFQGSLAETKPEIDRLLLCGINHIFFHGSTFSPEQAPWPGWRFYASTHFDISDPLWQGLPDMASYIARCQGLVQKGRTDNDALLYFPYHDMASRPGERLQQCSMHNPLWLEESSFGEAAMSLWNEGLHADYVSDRLLEGARVEGGCVAIAGARYKALGIPETKAMPLQTLSKIKELADAGAKVIFAGSLPKSSPGLSKVSDHSGICEKLAKHENVKLTKASGLCDAFKEAGARPCPSMESDGFDAIRFRLDDGRLAFFACNQSDKTAETQFKLNFKTSSAIVFDPLSGRKGKVEADGRQSTYLKLKPGESLFIMEPDAGEMKALGNWEWLEELEQAVLKTRGPWKLEFISGGPTLPAAAEMPTPASWTELPGQAYKDFSGTARYSVDFEWTPENGTEEAILKFDGVHDTAQVKINGMDCGTIWSHPFELPVGKSLKAGVNTLEIEATNAGANRIAAADRAGINWKSFHEINFVNIHYKPFDASAWSPAPSGLGGEARLAPCRIRRSQP